MFSVRIEASPIDPAALQSALARDPECTGAVATFTGHMRGAGLSAMALEHYPGMSEASIAASLAEAARRWPVQAAALVHRVGELYPGDPIVWVGVACAHRAAALRACEFIVDELKVSAPLWKRERDRAGRWRWVDARSCDRERARRWEAPAPAAAPGGPSQ